LQIFRERGEKRKEGFLGSSMNRGREGSRPAEQESAGRLPQRAEGEGRRNNLSSRGEGKKEPPMQGQKGKEKEGGLCTKGKHTF